MQDGIARPVETGDREPVVFELLYQRAADGLDDVAVELVLEPIGIDDLTAIVREVEFRHPDVAARPLHLDLGHRRDIGARQLVFAIGDAAAGDYVAALVAPGRRPLVPFRQGGGAVEHFDAALVVGIEIFQPELDGVSVCRRSKFVDEALVGVGVLHSPRRPDPGRAERRRCKPAAHRLHVGELVGDRRVLENVAGRDVFAGGHACQCRGDQRHVEAAGGLLRNEEFRFPGGNRACAIHGSAQIDERRRALGVPPVLVGARPLHPHRPPDRFRQQRRVRGGILVPVAAIAAGPFDVDAANAVGGDAEHGRELLAQIVRRLRGRPRGQLAILEFGDRTGRPDRAVRVDGEVVGGFERLGARLAHGLGSVTDVARHLVLGDLAGAHFVPKLRRLRQGLRFRPRRLELLRSLDRAPLALGDDAEEIALPHDLDDAGDIFERCLVDILERGADRRRANDAPVQHPGHAEVLHVGEASRHFVRDVDARHRLADQFVVLGIFRGGGLGVVELERERFASDQLAVADPFVAGADHAVDDLEILFLGV